MRRLAASSLAAWTIAIGWTALLFILLVQPDDQRLIETGIPRGPNTIERELFFTAMHLLAFGLTCGLWHRLLLRYAPLESSLLCACGISLALGGLTEMLQAFSPERYPSLGDLAANCAGTLLAAWLLRRRATAVRRS